MWFVYCVMVVLTCFVMCGCVYVWVLQFVGECMCGLCNVWLCVCVDCVMCGCVYVWVLQFVGVCMCGLCNVWLCVCVDCVMHGASSGCGWRNGLRYGG